MFQTRYGDAIVKVLQAYPLGSRSLIVAMEAVVKTAIENTKSAAKEEIARDVCLGYHDGPGSGLVCRKCFDTLEAGKLPPDPEDKPVLSAEEAEEVSQIEKHVRNMISAAAEE